MDLKFPAAVLFCAVPDGSPCVAGERAPLRVAAPRPPTRLYRRPERHKEAGKTVEERLAYFERLLDSRKPDPSRSVASPETKASRVPSAGGADRKAAVAIPPAAPDPAPDLLGELGRARGPGRTQVIEKFLASVPAGGLKAVTVSVLASSLPDAVKVLWIDRTCSKGRDVPTLRALAAALRDSRPHWHNVRTVGVALARVYRSALPQCDRGEARAELRALEEAFKDQPDVQRWVRPQLAQKAREDFVPVCHRRYPPAYFLRPTST